MRFFFDVKPVKSDFPRNGPPSLDQPLFRRSNTGEKLDRPVKGSYEEPEIQSTINKTIERNDE